MSGVFRRGAPRLAAARLSLALRSGPAETTTGLAQLRTCLGQGQPVWRSGLLASLLQRGYADLPAHQELAMPSLSPTMTQGNIAAWRKNEGDAVNPGDILAEVETDKATIEWEAQEEGFIAKILKPAGSKDIAVGTPVALLVEEEGDLAAFKDYSPSAAKASSAPAEAAPPPPAAEQEPASSSGGSWPAHEVLKMPALSPTMSMGNIVSWQKKVGDSVAPGDMLCEVETDKATIGWESQEEGFLAALLLPDGSKEVPVGAPAAVIVEEQEQVAAFANFTAADAAGSAAPKPAASAPPPSPPAAPPAAAADAGAAAAPEAPSTPPPRRAAAASGGRVSASPYARKLAAEAGVSLSEAAGSGPGGRITAADVQQLISSGGGGGAAPAPAAAADGGAAPSGGYTDVQVTQIKRVTAERLLQSKLTIPHYYLTMECELDSLLAARESLNLSLAGSGGKLSVNDFIVKAAALACRKVPAVNASWMGDFIRQYHNIDVNVAVNSPAGLMVPFVRGADKKGLLAISQEVKELAAKAKEGKLQPQEFMGGTFTISNLGMYGIKQFAAIVNPPQAAILAVGAALPKVVEIAPGEFTEVQVLTVTLSCDHRVVDGAVGAEWLKAFRQAVENPYMFML